MPLSMTTLRKKYPHAIRAIHSGGNDYCVGGALCREVGLDYDFPNEAQLKEALLKANPRIDWYAISDGDRDWAWNQIRGIIRSNDVGDFELSWHLLGELLRWKPKTIAERVE